MPDSRSNSSSATHGDGSFGSTRWSLVLEAGRDGSVAGDALEALCRTYWLPVYGFIRKRTRSQDDAQDLTQAFFAALFERKTISRADPARGRFRAFLLTAVKHFLANEHEWATAQKRGGGRPVLSLDFDVAETRLQRDRSRTATPEKEFERRWALALLERVIERLEEEQTRAGRHEQFQELRLFLTGQNEGATFVEAAQRLGISAEAARAAVHRLRKRYRALLREEIAQTVDTPDEVDDELAKLYESLSF